MSRITTDLDLALSHLKKGDIVAIPTETVYGLAGNAENAKAIEAIYAIKNRPLNHPLIMHVAEDWDLSRWVSFIPDYAKVLIQHFWPGPLTLVMKKTEAVSPLLTGGQDTVALRCPKHPVAQTLLKRLGLPLVAPSANPFGKISPTTALHVKQSFKEADLLILDGGRCEVGIESTILSAVNPAGYSLLRPGVIDIAQINALIGDKALKEESTLRVPGKLANHYQPEKPLFCFATMDAIDAFCQSLTEPVYVLSFTDSEQADYCFSSSPAKAAFELYYQLRLADESPAHYLVIELPPLEAQWEGVRERILKAGQKA
ncbi:MAG: L-threonylcarbamoyladenylate synthase [Tatlockia sp.]|jgi:L-threonylcarbamoyladenylate synthase